MGSDEPGQGVDIDLYTQCLASIEGGRIAFAKRQARGIESPAMRAIAQDQIRFVLKIKACLARGDRDRAVILVRSLIGGIRQKYEVALGIGPPPREEPPASLRSGGEEPPAGEAAGRGPPDLASFPPEIRGDLELLTLTIGRSRSGERPPDFPPEVLRQLGWIARRSWRRWGGAKGAYLLRASASEIRITGACLRRRFEGDGGRLSVEDLVRETGLSRTSVYFGVRNLRQFLLQGSGWRMVGDVKTGVALEPQDPDVEAR
jgi:hypothetical protein